MKFMCKNGHLRNSSELVDNCSVCKRNQKRRIERMLKGTLRQKQAAEKILASH